MGKRIERIYQYILENTRSGLGEKKGLSTSEVADHLAIQRSNASKDLNQLVKEGRVEKVIHVLCAIGQQVLTQAVRKSMSQAIKKIVPKGKKLSLSEYKENLLTGIFLRQSLVPMAV